MRYLFALLCCFTIASVSAQKTSPVVVKTKIVAMYYKGDTEELRLPVISNKYPVLKAALCDTALLEGETIDSVKKDFETQDFGITSFNYKISYQNQRFISFIFYYESMGAHPNQYKTYNTYNIKTGQIYDLANELTPAGLKYVFNRYKAVFVRDLRSWQNPHIKRDSDAVENREVVTDALKDYIKALNQEDLFKNYVFTPKGILINSGDILSYAFRGLYPDKDVLISYEELKAYRKK
jgi:hypothetical protein